MSSQRAVAEKANSVANNYAFRATGTNRTLNQLVVFTGSLEEGASAPVTGMANGTGGFGGGAQNVNVQPSAPEARRYGLQVQGGVRPGGAPGQAAASQNNYLNQSRIQGSASVAGNQLKIDALQVGP